VSKQGASNHSIREADDWGYIANNSEFANSSQPESEEDIKRHLILQINAMLLRSPRISRHVPNYNP
jgi:hypothetical protein